MSNCLGANVQHQRVHQRNIVARADLVRDLQIGAQLRQEGDRCAGLQVRVEILLEAYRLNGGRVVDGNPWRSSNIIQHIDLKEKSSYFNNKIHPFLDPLTTSAAKCHCQCHEKS